MRVVVGAHYLSRRCAEEKNPLPVPEINPRASKVVEPNCTGNKNFNTVFTSSKPPLVTQIIRYSNPITGLDRPRGFHEVEVPRFQDNRHMKVVSLSALRTGRLYPPGNIPGTQFC